MSALAAPDRPVADTDPVTAAYLAQCRTGAFDGLPKLLSAHPRLAAWQGEFLSRPLFLPEAGLRSFAADLGRVLDLLVSLPQRLFDGDTDAFAARLGVEERRAALMRLTRDGAAAPRYGRADVYFDGDAYRVLEFGVASDVGGVDRAGVLPQVFLEHQGFAEFAARHGLGHVDTGLRVAQALRQAARDNGDPGDPVVVLLEGPGGMARYGSAWRPLQQVLRSLGIDCHLGELDRVTLRGSRLVVGSTAVNVVFRCFDVDQLLAEPDGPRLLRPVLAAQQAGTAVLWTPLDAELFGDKTCMALLSHPRWRQEFTVAERQLLDRVLPWTRVLDAGDAALLDECLRCRTELIVKPATSYGGEGIVAGWECTGRQWERALAEGSRTAAIVQRRAVTRVEPVWDGEVRPWEAALGVFYTPQGYAGTYGKALPAGLSAVIGVTAHARTRTAGVFHHGGGEE